MFLLFKTLISDRTWRNNLDEYDPSDDPDRLESDGSQRLSHSVLNNSGRSESKKDNDKQVTVRHRMFIRKASYCTQYIARKGNDREEDDRFFAISCSLNERIRGYIIGESSHSHNLLLNYRFTIQVSMINYNCVRSIREKLMQCDALTQGTIYMKR